MSRLVGGEFKDKYQIKQLDNGENSENEEQIPTVYIVRFDKV